jgi:hypothetical protein
MVLIAPRNMSSRLRTPNRTDENLGMYQCL